jgi:hypothetical protein
MGNNARQGTPANAGHTGGIQFSLMFTDSRLHGVKLLKNKK